MTTIAVIGAGNVSSSFAKRAVAVGYNVILANSRGPASLSELVSELGPLATAEPVDSAARHADIVFVAMPINHYSELPSEAFTGKIVIDAGNYYPAWNGSIPELDSEATTTAEILQAHLPDSFVVKAFNNLGALSIVADAAPAGTANRRALSVAGDNEEARRAVASLIDRFGFESVDVGLLAEGWRYQRDLPAYGTRHNVAEMTKALANAQRYRGLAS